MMVRAVSARIVRIGAVVVCIALCLPVWRAAARQADSRQRPNVVLIITDDVGYGDFGSYGAPDVKTPRIDSLATEGVRLTDFYAAPVCTPTRAMLITGRYPQRVALERPIQVNAQAFEQGLPVTGNSLPQLVRQSGYATGLVGKWHLGYKPEFGPNAHGFDYFFGFLSGYIDFYHHTRGTDGKEDLYENTTPVHETGYMTDLITSRAVRYIEQHAAQPFFLEVAYNAAHWPFQPPDRESRSPDFGAFPQPGEPPVPTRQDYVAMLERADSGVGEILDTLARLKLNDRTLVIFTNDNGGEWLSRNAPLFHRKDTLWEGGIRVPAIFRWPGHLARGKTSDQVGITMDLTRTILGLTGANVPESARLEGIDLLPLLRGDAPAQERTLFWRIATSQRQQRAVRRGDFKLLIDGDDVMLFNLRKDIGERDDLTAARQDLIKPMRALIAEWEKDVDAEAAAKKQ